MKKLIKILNVLLFSTSIMSTINACSFFDDSHNNKPKILYEKEQHFYGTRSDYNQDIISNVSLGSWKKYVPDWLTFIKKYKLLNFDDNSIIEVNTPTYNNESTVTNYLTGPSLSIDTSKINSSQNKTKNQFWLLRFNYDYWSVHIYIYTKVYFWYSEITNNIYFSIHLEEHSNNAVEGPYFKVKINNIFFS